MPRSEAVSFDCFHATTAESGRGLTEGKRHPCLSQLSGIGYAQRCETLQQVRNGTATCVRNESHYAYGAGVNVDTIRLCEQDIACGNFKCSSGSIPTEHEEPGFSLRFHAPGGIWRQINPFKDKVRIGNEKLPFCGKLARSCPTLDRPRHRHR